MVTPLIYGNSINLMIMRSPKTQKYGVLGLFLDWQKRGIERYKDL